MFKQSSRRNQRNNKGVKVKHVVQICVLLGVCIWLLYEVPRVTSSSHETIRISEKLQYPTDIKLGRKDLQPRTEEDENEKPREDPPQGFVAFDDENKPADTSMDKSYGDETVDEGRGKEVKDDEDKNGNDEEKYDERNDAKERTEDESKEKMGDKEKQSEEEATKENERKLEKENEESKEQEEKAENDKLNESSFADEVKNGKNNEEQVDVQSSKYASGPDNESSPPTSRAESGSAKGQSGKSSTENDSDNEDTKIDEKKIFFNDTNSDEMVESKLKKLIKEMIPMSSSKRVDTVVNDQVDLSGLLPEAVREARADLDTLPKAGNEVKNVV